MAASVVRSQVVLAALVGACVCLTGGCGPKGPTTVPAGGTVLHQGKPLQGATVIFSPKGTAPGPAPVAIGMTGADGRFELSTQASPTRTVPGAVPGEHRVVISKFVPPDGMTEDAWQKLLEAEKATMEAKGVVDPAEAAPPKVQLLPPNYSDSQQTTLSATVQSGEKNEFAFELE